MKAKLTQEYAWCFDGISPTTIAAGTIVEGAVARNALSIGAAVEISEDAPPHRWATAIELPPAPTLPEPTRKDKDKGPAPKNKALTKRKAK